MPSEVFWLGLKKHLSLFRRVFLFGAAVFVVLNLFVVFIRADNRRNQGAQPDIAKIEAEQKRKLYARMDEKLDSKYTKDEVLIRQFDRLVMCKIAGELCTSNQADAQKYKDSSLAGFIGKAVALPFKHPPSSFYYVAQDTLQNAGFVPKTYAAGVGFDALASYRPIWKAFRNLAYIVIVLVMMVIGFMVMFGVGGGGKTAVTFEAALPRLVIALLAISFSYALAGLFVDFMYISVALTMSYFGPLAGYSPLDQNQAIAEVLGGGGGGTLWKFLWGGVTEGHSNFWYLSDALWDLLPVTVRQVFEGIVSAVALKLAANVGVKAIAKGGPPAFGSGARGFALNMVYRIGAPLAAILGKSKNILDPIKDSGGGMGIASIVGAIILIVIELIASSFLVNILIRTIITLILVLGLVYVFIKIFFAMLFVYVDIFLSITVSPLLLMLEAIPGQNSLMKWMRGLLVNLAVFPLVIVIVLLARIIFNSSYTSEKIWEPPFVNAVQGQGNLQLLIGGVLIYSIPQIIKTFRKKLGGESLLGSLNLGLGSLLVGAAPLLKGGSTVLGQAGLGGAMAKRLTKPFGSMLNMTLDPVTGNWKPK